ncbi:MAG TPA: 5-deoxy-glucuronate isomerase [Thermoleophilaceae bacterium]|nr:5-deoxy-glucuronate isomerase [Thermoleophilaceae bacterium]
MSSLLTHPPVTPDSAGWRFVGFDVIDLTGESQSRHTDDRELCLVVLAGTCNLRSAHGEWTGLGGRPNPFDGRPDAAYLPPGTEFELSGEGEVALCTAPASGGAAARVLPGDEIEVEVRGHGAQERTVTPILMGDEDADSLLVCEVLTPPGHWSSYPPHKHDRDAMPEESFLEETYYHRISPPQGFALQRVYTRDGELDETVVVRDRDVVLVPRGYHTVSAPPGYTVYYLNVMAGPVRAWAIANDPDHEWILSP